MITKKQCNKLGGEWIDNTCKSTTKMGEKVKGVLHGVMDKVKKDCDWKDAFDDTKIYTDKIMTYEHNKDESKGWTGTMSSISEKPKDSNVVILVTYDGAGYDLLSISEGATVTNQFEKELRKKFGDRFSIEHCNNWAFEVYNEE